MVLRLMNKAIDELIDELLALDVVKEYFHLAELLKKEPVKNNKIMELHQISKQMVNAKEIGLTNTYLSYQTEYNRILKEIDEDVLIQMFLQKQLEVNEVLEMVTKTIEDEIASKLN